MVLNRYLKWPSQKAYTLLIQIFDSITLRRGVRHSRPQRMCHYEKQVLIYELTAKTKTRKAIHNWRSLLRLSSQSTADNKLLFSQPPFVLFFHFLFCRLLGTPSLFRDHFRVPAFSKDRAGALTAVERRCSVVTAIKRLSVTGKHAP